MAPGMGPDPAHMPEVSIEDDFRRKREEMRHVAKDCVVVVDNIPKIKKDKYPKLVARLTPRFQEVGRLQEDEDGSPKVTFVVADNGSTLGFAFAEYITPEEAHKAVMGLHRHVLDRTHTFWACTASDLEQLQNVPAQFVPPAPLPIATTDRPNYKSWLLDSRGRDMFMIRHNDETNVYWHDHVVKPQLVRKLFALCLTKSGLLQ